MTGSTTDVDTKASHRVLIAEDEALIRLDLAEMLREEGYEVVGEAGDGQEAVELAEEHKPDVVGLDGKMPRRDAGAMAYLVNPGTISALIPAIELAMSRFSESRALERYAETLSERLETR